MLFKDGVIVGKWNVADLPLVEEMAESPTGMPDSMPTWVVKMRGWQLWTLLLVLPLLLFVLLDVAARRASKSEPAAATTQELG